MTLHAKEGNRICVTHDVRELIDGLMLGDGTLAASRLSAALSIEQTDSHNDWLLSINTELVGFGFRTAWNTRPSRGKIAADGRAFAAKPSVILRTPFYRDLLAERLRWYPDGVKRVPDDVIVSRRSVSLWFMGDGSTGKNRCGINTVSFSTHAFPEEDVLRLARLLELNLHVSGWRVSHWRGMPILALSKRIEAGRFLDIMRPLVADSFIYKVPFQRSNSRPCSACGKSFEFKRLTPLMLCTSCLKQRRRAQTNASAAAWRRKRRSEDPLTKPEVGSRP